MLEAIACIEFRASMHSFLMEFKRFFYLKYHFEALEEALTGLWSEEMFAGNVTVNVLSLSCGQRV